jgi:hypothetical protein
MSTVRTLRVRVPDEDGFLGREQESDLGEERPNETQSRTDTFLRYRLQQGPLIVLNTLTSASHTRPTTQSQRSGLGGAAVHGH